MPTKTTRKSASGPAQKRRPQSAATPKTVERDGTPGLNRHFKLDRALVELVRVRATAEGFSIAEVLRQGMRAALEESNASADPLTMPTEAIPTLRRVWESGDNKMINAYFAALYNNGWTVQKIADSLVASGAVHAMSRQAVHQRIKRADDEVPDGMPDVPEAGPRRKLMGPAADKPSPDELWEFTFRIDRDLYERFREHVKRHGALTSSYLEALLRQYCDGDLVLVREDD